MNRHLIFALCAAVGFSVSGGSLAQDAPADKEAAAKAAKAAKVKFRWGKSLKSAQKQSEETGLPIVLLFTGTSWCGYCVKLEKEVLSKKEFKQGMDGVAIGVKFEFSSSDFSKSKEAKTYKVTGVPAMVVVDAEGKELGRTGYIPGRTPVQYVEFFKKYACNASAILLTGVLAGVATRGCYFVYYQPEVPENLKNFSKNK